MDRLLYDRWAHVAGRRGGNARLRSDRDFCISVDLKALTDAMTEVMWHCDDPVVCLPDADGTP